MHEPILKIHWERFQTHIELDVQHAALLLAPYTQETIDQLILLSEGCANTNYKITFKNHSPPVIIRIYVREKSALQREVAIHQLVKDAIPVPTHFYFDDSCTIYPYAYSIMEWIDGSMMREVILSKDEKAIRECCYDAGTYLSVLRQIKFSHGGFFEDNLQIIPFSQEEKYLPYVLNILQDKIVKESLDTNLHQAVLQLVKNYSDLLPDKDEANLTHSDYDPANILIRKIGDQWKIAAILDWEFAYSGTYLLDIGTMIRYSHKLPDCYENSFIMGITDHSSSLPKEWKKQAKLMDLLCLLQLLHYNPASERPKMNRDVVSLIENTVKSWNSF